MQTLGLKPPSTPRINNIGGFLPIKSLSDMMADETATADAIKRADAANNKPVMQSLVSYIKNHWTLAKEAKEPVEGEMLSAVRARRGEYDPETLARIKKQGG